MCRLLGLIANQPVDLAISMHLGSKSFRDLADESPDGWGLGWYEGGSPKVFKEAVSAADSDSLRSHASAESKIFVSHVRRASPRIAKSHENCHPFVHRNWMFAHNGTVDRPTILNWLCEPWARDLEGTTDSEVYFRWLLQNLHGNDSAEAGLGTAISAVKASPVTTGLNFVMSDGARLIAFRDANIRRDWYSLHLLERNPTARGPVTTTSREVEELLESKKLSGERAILICSEPLLQEPWQEVGLGEVVIADTGLQISRRTIL